ncbi:low-specificity L-threonine aldolase [candidate division KSB1 bacterium]|nr:low-specificity L-threonine aldolase [candidate division KSB1 bacterium]
MKPVDLRSDTITKPTDAMRRVMAEAEVGDDVFGEDPSVNALQDKVAELFGMEAALFVTSGTMGNQLAIKCHTEPGDEVICEENCHSFNYEAGGPAFLSAVQLRPLPGVRGVITTEQIDAAIRPPDHHFPRSQLVVIENTHNRAGGAIFPLEEIKKIRALTRERHLKVHLDGARIWNAHIATGIPLQEYGRHFDSITVCLSKGLGAPVGSVLAGSRAFIDRAHRFRKIWGGGMRQAGIIAAAGLYAIEHHLARLAEDHARAQKLAQCLSSHPKVRVDMQATQTNIVIADFHETGLKAPDIVVTMKEHGLYCIAFSPTKLRMVTHLDLKDEDIDRAVQIIDKVLQEKLT